VMSVGQKIWKLSNVNDQTFGVNHRIQNSVLKIVVEVKTSCDTLKSSRDTLKSSRDTLKSSRDTLKSSRSNRQVRTVKLGPENSESDTSLDLQKSPFSR
jgi:outer membrane protein TolC